MSMEQSGTIHVHPAALDFSFSKRKNEYLTGRLHAKLLENMEVWGITDFLDELGGPGASRRDAFIGIMDPMREVHAIPDIRDPKSKAVLDIGLAGPHESTKRDNLFRFFQLSTSGLGGEYLPDFHFPGYRNLVMGRVGYPIPCISGRIGSVLLKQHFKMQLGHNQRLVERPLGVLRAAGIVRHLPSELRQEVDYHYDVLPSYIANEILLTSGHLSLIGRALRNTLDRESLIVQYPGRHRPRIEQGTPFFGHGPIPISSTNIRLTVGGKMGERLREIADDPIETAKFIAELATEEGALGLIDGILMVGAAWGAATVGTGIDLWLKHLLKRKQKRLSSPPKSLL